MPATDHHITLVLGGGGARGFAHIGVIKCLQEHHIPISSVVGTSIGSIVGGAYAAGMDAAAMEKVVKTIDTMTIAKMMLPGISSTGLVRHDHMRKFLVDLIGDRCIEDLPVVFRAVSTDLITGEEFVFEKGSLIDAILASIALPVLFQPAYFDGRYLVDGGLSNPLPVSVGQNLQPDFCIAVNVTPNPERLRAWIQRKTDGKEQQKNGMLHSWFHNKLASETSALAHIFLPTALRVTLQSVSISSHNLLSHHLRQARPDLLITPQIEEFELLEFHKGSEIMEKGYEAAQLAMDVILRMV